MADSNVTQEDFSGGIFRGRRAPANSVYDAVNALVNDEGLLERRGGTDYLSSSNFGSTVLGLWHGYLTPGERLLAWSSTDAKLLTGGAWSASLGFGSFPVGRIFTAGGFAFFQDATGQVYTYAGASNATFYSTGTVATTADSATVTGTGTAFLANVSAGSILIIGSSPPRLAIIKTVDSNTQLTLRDPWPATASGQAYFTQPLSGVLGNPQISTPADAIGVAAGRLLACKDDRVYYTGPLTGTARVEVESEIYHQLPDGARGLGVEGIGNDAMVFTTSGLFVIGNMAFGTFDDAGNLQHTVSQLSRDVILWGDEGIAAWENVRLVPALDDVYLLGLDGTRVVVSEKIRPLYRSYVQAGYKPGLAAVHRGHYFLPILNGSTLVDALVCRLDRGFAWTRWSGHAASRAYAVQITTAEPKLYGVAAQRVTDLTDTFEQSSTDADGAVHQMQVTTSDLGMVGPGRRSATAEKAEVVYELTGGGTAVTVEWSSGEEGAAFTALTAVRGGAASDGSASAVWPVNKSRRSIRLRVTQTGAAAKFLLRQVGLRVRGPGV